MKSAPKADVRNARRIGGTYAVVLLVCLVTGSASGQEPAAEPAATFFEPIRVPLVNVEVVVNGEDGKPIRGLTAADFEVFEDGQPVEISHFFAAESAAGTAGESDARAAYARYDNRPSQDLYLTVFLDDTTVDPRVRTTVLTHLADFLSQPVQSDVKTMLVRFDGSLQVATDFSRDSAEVLRALDRIRREPALSSVNREGQALVRDMQARAAVPRMQKEAPAPFINDFEKGPSPYVIAEEPNDHFSYLPEIRSFLETCRIRSRTSMDALERYVNYLSGVPGRKVVLWIGDLEMRAGENVYRTWQELFPDQARHEGSNPMMETMQNDLSRTLRELVDHANAQRVSFYTVGTLTDNFSASAAMNNRIFERSGSPGQQGSQSSFGRNDAKKVMSELTGGRLMMAGRNFDEQLDDVSADLGTYYSLAYSPPSPGDGEYHEITVKVNREGAQLSHRKGYREGDVQLGAGDKTLSAALLGVTDNPLGIEVECEEQEAREKGTFMVPVRIKIPIGDLVLEPQEGHHTARVSVFFVISDEAGRPSQVYERSYPIEIPNDQLLAAVGQKADFVVGMLLEKGPHRIAVSVRDDWASTESTVFVDMEAGIDEVIEEDESQVVAPVSDEQVGR